MKILIGMLAMACAQALLPVAGAAHSPAAGKNEAYKPLFDRLESISQMPLPDWRAHPADVPHGEDINLADSDWPTVAVDEKWDTGSRWLRREIVVPDKLEGYELRGSRLDLDLFITSDDFIQLTVFVNGNMVARADEDTQLPITLTQDAQPGQKFLVAARVLGNTKPTRILRARVLALPSATHAGDPAFLREELISAQPLIGAYQNGRKEREDQFGKLVKVIDFAALGSNQATFESSLRKAQDQLEAFRPYLRQFKIHATGNSHIDMAWLWPWTETVEVVRNTFSSALQLMREYPELTFTMGSAQTFQWMEEKYPALFSEIQQRVKEGRWELVGGMWVEPDLNMPDGESLVRQLLYGKRYFQDKFGVDVKIGWNPDSFGYSWQLPQIYKRSGVDYFVTQKLAWNDTNPFPDKLFWWQSPDGSRVLTYLPHDYANAVDPARMATDLSVFAPGMWKADAGAGSLPAGQLEMMHLFGIGDHGGGPTRRDLDTARRWSASDAVYPQLEFGTATAFFNDLEFARSRNELNIPTWNDELYFEYHRGVQTTQSETKRGNRKSEVALLNAEKLAAIGTLLGFAYPKAGLDEAWRNVLFNQFHDILPGSGIAVNYVDAARKYEEVGRITGKTIDETLRALATGLSPDETSILVFNPLPWERGGVIEVEMPYKPKGPGLPVFAFSPHNEWLGVGIYPGAELTRKKPCATPDPFCGIEMGAKGMSSSRLRINVDRVPPLGYEVLRITESASNNTAGHYPLEVTPDSIANEFIKITVDPHTGCITSLFDKISQTEALAPAVPGDGAPAANPDGKPCGNLLQVFEDKPKHWDAWNIDADFIKHHADLLPADEVAVTGGTIRVKKHYGDSQFVQEIIMVPGIDRVDVHMTVDWHEKHKLLKVAFPLSVHSDHATFEIPYGSIERPTTRRTPQEQAKFEVPALRWADMSDSRHGFSLLNDSKYGYDAKDNVLRLSLLRSPEWPDPHADEGPHEFTYSLYPHGGAWRKALTIRKGYELNYPLLAVPSNRPAASESFFSADAENVIINAVKRSEDGRALVVRLYEWDGKKGDVQLKVPEGISSAWEADLMEHAGAELQMSADKRSVTVPVSPYEIKTILLRFGD